MSEGPIILEADDSAVEATCKDAEQKLDVIETNRRTTETSMRQTLTRTTRMISGVIGMTTSVFSMLGGALDPFGQAILGCVTSTITAMQAVSMAMASNPITAAFAGITATVAIMLSVRTLADVALGINRSKDDMRRVQDMLRMAHSGYILFKGAQM